MGKMSKFSIPFLLLLFLSRTDADCVEFLDCSEYNVHEIDIQGCKCTPCPVKIGSWFTVKVNATATFRSSKFEEKAYIKLSTIYTEVEIEPKACTASRPCPVLMNSDASFTVHILTPDIPNFKGYLEFSLTGDNGLEAICFKTGVKVCRDEQECRKPYHCDS